MNVEEYQDIIQKTAIYPTEVGLAYCALGLTGESGEVAEKIKKLYRDNQDLIPYIQMGQEPADVNTRERYFEIRKDVLKELGDVIWYVTALANEFGLPLSEILEANYNKLIKRRETGTLQGSGDHREET